MNIQLLMELQANIHGNDLINSIFQASTWFVKYTEVFMIFPILFSSWLLKHNGIFLLIIIRGLLIIIVIPDFHSKFFSYFLNA